METTAPRLSPMTSVTSSDFLNAYANEIGEEAENRNFSARCSLISKASEIEGWFDEVELDLLVNCVAEASLRNSDSHNNLNIVEIGSHKGRSTVAMGLALASLSVNGMIYAVDPHEGMRSGKHNRIYRGPQT